MTAPGEMDGSIRSSGKALALLATLALLASCRREEAPAPLIVIVTLDSEGMIRLRDARNGAVVREVGDPCGDQHTDGVLPSPPGDALIVECEADVYRVTLDGGSKTALGRMDISAVSGDGKLVWGTLPDRTDALLHTDGSGHTPIARGTLVFPIANRLGFIDVVPGTRELIQIRYVPGSGARVTPIVLERGVEAGRPLVSLARNAPLVITRDRGRQRFLARLDEDGRVSDLAEADPVPFHNAVNHEYAVYFDRWRVYRLGLQPGAVPVVVLEHVDTSGLYPGAVDPRGRLLLAYRRDVDNLGVHVCIDVATGRQLGTFRLDSEWALEPLIEIH